MSRIDGIKNSIGHIKRYAETVHAESYLDDVQYLLAKLEQAEMVLRLISGEEKPREKLIHSLEKTAKLAVDQIFED